VVHPELDPAKAGRIGGQQLPKVPRGSAQN
jgi:hypothetical protein